MDRLSVILPNYEHFHITKVHVREVMNQEIMPYEIIVVNDGGGKELRDILLELKPFRTKVRYAYILPPKIPWNYNGAVNLGVWLSVGDYLVIEDNDNIPMRGLYIQMLNRLLQYPEVGRVTAAHRRDISSDQLDKPSSEWKSVSGRGPNQGSYMMRRKAYTMLKGQDERMAGGYGWMYYDWRARLLGKAKIQFGTAGDYWYVTDGQSTLSRKHHSKNYGIYRQNARSPDNHHEYGILNFKFTVEDL
jgi:glycosyltransferase involved in cell wall biosynthesis